MKHWWENLTIREKQIISIGGMMVAIFLFYQLIIAPVHHWHNALRTTVNQDESLLNWMKAANQQINQLRGTSVNGQLTTVQTLLTTTDQSVRTSTIAHNLTSIQQNANNTIDVKFSSVSFDALTQWLVSIRQHNGIQAKQITIERLDNQGAVQASLTLETANR